PVTKLPVVGFTLATTACEVPWPVTTVKGDTFGSWPVTKLPVVGFTLATTACEVPWPVTTVCRVAAVPLTTGRVSNEMGPGALTNSTVPLVFPVVLPLPVKAYPVPSPFVNMLPFAGGTAGTGPGLLPATGKLVANAGA